MTALVWDQVGERVYQNGVDHGVLGIRDGTVVAWNGLTSVEETPNKELSEFFLDGLKYLEYETPGDFSANLKALTYPDEFDLVNGTSKPVAGLQFHDQPPKPFNLSYRTKVSNDLDGEAGYIIHLLYNIIANPDSTNYSTLSEQVDPIEFGWVLSGRPVRRPATFTDDSIGWRPTSHLSIDSREISSDLLSSFEDGLYGTEEESPVFPSIQDILTLLTEE